MARAVAADNLQGAAALAIILVLASCAGQSVTTGFSQAPEVYSEDLVGDVMFCMRVRASSTEVERFVTRVFKPGDRVAVHPNDSPLRCPAEFWPRSWSNPTTAYRSKRVGGEVSSTECVIVLVGFLYYWDISI